ncbi:hypothetical protein LXL04_019803 [Taraxacum kok-saghyz]
MEEEVDDLMLMVLVVATQVFCGNGGEKLLQLAEGLLKKHIASHSLHEPEALTVYISLLEQQAKYRDATEVLSGNLGSLIMIEVDKLRIQRNWRVVNEVAWMRFEDGWFVWKFVVECLGLVLNNLNLVCLKYIKVRTHGFKPKPKSYGLNPRTHETVKPPHETVKPNPLQTHRVGFRKLETDLAGSWVGFTPNPSKPYPCSPLLSTDCAFHSIYFNLHVLDLRVPYQQEPKLYSLTNIKQFISLILNLNELNNDSRA